MHSGARRNNKLATGQVDVKYRSSRIDKSILAEMSPIANIFHSS